ADRRLHQERRRARRVPGGRPGMRDRSRALAARRGVGDGGHGAGRHAPRGPAGGRGAARLRRGMTVTAAREAAEWTRTVETTTTRRMKMTKTGAFIAASVAGLLASTVAPALAHAEGGDQVVCDGINSCKGHGSCKGGGHACAGKNGCKGQGHTNTTKEDCMAKGGKV